jgi:hypothetical protein
VKLLIVLTFILTSCASLYDAPKPKWAEREDVQLKDGELTWFLGSANSRNSKEAKAESDLDSKKNITELVSKNVNLFSKSMVEDRVDDARSRNKVFSYSDVLPVPLEKKRVYSERVDGRYIHYTDIAVKTANIQTVQKTSKPVEFDKALNQQELDTSIYDVNEEYDRGLEFLDKEHIIHWSPFNTDGSHAVSFGYERSFARRRFGIEFGFISNSNESEEYINNKGYEYDAYNKQYIDLNYSLIRNHDSLLILTVGGTKKSSVEGYKDGFNDKETIEKEMDLSGYAYGIKYRSLFHESDWGYQLELKQEVLSGTNKDGDEVENEQIPFGSFGLFVNF